MLIIVLLIIIVDIWMLKGKFFVIAYQLLLYSIPRRPNKALMFSFPKDSIIWKIEEGDEKGQETRYPTNRH